MSFINDPINYAYFNVKVKAKVAQLLSFSDYDRLIKAANIEEIARILSNTTYGEIGLTQKLIDQKKSLSGNEIDNIMTTDFQQLISDLAKHLPRTARRFAKKFTKKFYYDSLKIILRSKHLNLEKSSYDYYIKSPIIEDMETLNRLMDFNNISQIIDAIPEWQIRRILLDAMPIYEQTNSSLVLEQAINIGYYTEVWKELASLTTQGALALRLLGTEIDLTNIKTILRSKEIGIEREAVKRWLIPLKHRLGSFEPFLQGKTTDIVNLISSTPYRDFAYQVQEAIETGDELGLNKFETVISQYLVHQAIKTFRGTTFHLGTFIAYFILKRTEFENVRAIIVGKMAGIDQESIKDMIIYY
ncbi:MAG: V-type ATPase subunit [Candidatus Hodarchaeales archaeon]|jgi:V/A-type H+-transporting ATPase subunit C